MAPAKQTTLIFPYKRECQRVPCGQKESFGTRGLHCETFFYRKQASTCRPDSSMFDYYISTLFHCLDQFYRRYGRDNPIQLWAGQLPFHITEPESRKSIMEHRDIHNNRP